MTRSFARIACAAAIVSLSFSSALVAGAATQASSSDEIGGASVAAHTTAQNLRTAWANQVAASGGTATAPVTLNQPTYANGSTISGVINIAADGTTTSAARTRYTSGASPTLVGPSTNPGTATCTTSGTSLQGGAPRPTTLESNATCSNAAGFAYAEAGGAGENTTRDAVEFTFSRPVLGFGAWFGDLETRTDGNGVAAIVRLYGVGGVLLSDQQVQPGPTYLPQSACNNTYTGCGNNTTRWLGFVADPAQPVLRMVVIVGDEDAGGTALDEGMGFIGPSLDLSTATLSLSKSADPLSDTNADGVIGAGDTVRYNFAVTNGGSLPVTAVAITDPGATALNCPSGAVAAGAVATCTGRHVLTQAEVNAGSLTNTARASANVYGGTISSSPSTLVVPIASSPGLSLTKSVTEATFDAVGDILHFQVTARNTGNVTLTGVSISDPSPGTGAFTSTCQAVGGALAPGATASCAVTYTTTQADLDGGLVANVATASATAPGPSPVGPVTATATSSAVQQVGLTLSKSVAQPTYDAVGDTLTYTVTATNNGNVTLTNVTVTDPTPGDGAFNLDCSNLPPTLAPDASGTCTATYATTQGDLDAGAVTNVASATAVGSAVPVDAPDAAATSTVVTHPGLSIVKTVDEPTFDAVGDELSYTVTVTNTGNVRVHAVTLTDPAPGPGAFDLDCSGLPAGLPAGASGSCVATYTVTQADLDDGSVVNDASASALLPNNTPVDSPTATAASSAEQSASLSLIKSAETATFDEVGDVVTFGIALRNAGNVTLNQVVVTDPAPGSGAFALDCSDLPSTLAPDDVGSCVAEYTVTQADLDGGSVTNIASASASGPGGVVATPDSQATSTALQAPAMTVTKTVDSDVYSAVGDVLTYTITVTNTGNVRLSGVALTDDSPGNGAFDLDCSDLPAALAPGNGGTCTATYAITQTDLDDGSVTNSATADAMAPSRPVSAESFPATSNAAQSASLEVVKTVDSATYDAVADVLTYNVTVTNSGNVTLTGVGVDDTTSGGGAFAIDCTALPSTLQPGGTGACVATYAVTQADLDAGSVVNTVVAVGQDPNGGGVHSPAATATSTAISTASPSLRVVKTVDSDVYSAVGDVLSYTITVSNIGNMTLSQVGVTDSSPGAGVFNLDCSGLPTTLAPGTDGECVADYTVTQADLDSGSVTNVASASATGPGGPTGSNAQVTSTAQQTPELTVAKTVDAATYQSAGDVLTYTIAVANTGNVILTGVDVVDPAPGLGDFSLNCDGLPAVLRPDAGGTCTASYAVTQQDIDAGSVTNIASVSATAPNGPVSAPDAEATSTAEQRGALHLTNTVDARSYDTVGDTLTYTITVTNNGNVSLSGIAVTDNETINRSRIAVPEKRGEASDVDLDCSTLPTTLAPGMGGTCTATYVVTQADLDGGAVVNTAQAVGESPGGVVSSAAATATSTAKVAASLSLVKVVRESSYAEVGDVLHYTITARNTGNVSLRHVVIADPAPGDGEFTTTCGTIGSLAPGAVAVCVATYSVTAADLVESELTNTASASAPGQVSAVAASATSTSNAAGPQIPDTGARNLNGVGVAGVALALSGLVLIASALRRRSQA